MCALWFLLKLLFCLSCLESLETTLNKKCIPATIEIVSKLLEEREKMLGHVKFAA